MVATTGPGIEPVGTEELEQATAGQRVPCPFDLQIWDVDRMLNFEIADDPAYEGLELQVFDDPVHGRGMVVLLRRRQDGRFDVYRQPGLALDPAYVQIGGELGEWRQASIAPARFDIGPCGIDVDIRLTDLAGREIRVRIDERDRRRRHQGTLLAPVGSTIEHPVSLPLFLMGGCDLVRPPGTNRRPLCRSGPRAGVPRRRPAPARCPGTWGLAAGYRQQPGRRRRHLDGRAAPGPRRGCP